MSLFRRNRPAVLPGGAPTGPTMGERRKKVKTSVSDGIGAVFAAGKKGTEAVGRGGKKLAQGGKDAAKRTGKKVNDYIDEDKILTEEQLDAHLQTQRSTIETYPQNVAFEPLNSHGTLQGFTSNQLPYSLNIIDQIIEGTDTYYVVQQVDKISGKKGKYAFVNEQGIALVVQSNTYGTLGALFFNDYEIIDNQTVRVQGAPNGPYETAGLDLTSVPTAPVPSSYATAVAQGIYNKHFPENQVFIARYRTECKEARVFVNDMFATINILTPAERRNMDLDNEIYIKQLRVYLDKFVLTTSDFYKDLVQAYPHKYTQYQYHTQFLENLWNERIKLKNNSHAIRDSYTSLITAQMKLLFEKMTEERL